MPQQIYAIGDIHGQMGMLDTALQLIESDGGAGAAVVFLGDYTDRGPDSKAGLEGLINGQSQGRNWHFVKGNHDRMFEWFLETPSRPDPYLLIEYSWLHPRLGGAETLQSYDINMGKPWRFMDLHAAALQHVPHAHYEFLRDLPLFYDTDDIFFTHAGIRPGVPLKAQDEQDLLWIRQEFHTATTPPQYPD